MEPSGPGTFKKHNFIFFGLADRGLENTATRRPTNVGNCFLLNLGCLAFIIIIIIFCCCLDRITATPFLLKTRNHEKDHKVTSPFLSF